MAKDMRSYMEELKHRGEILTLAEQFDVDAGIGQYLFAQRDKAVLFGNVAGYPKWNVLGQAPANMRHIGIAFDCDYRNVVKEFARRIAEGLRTCRIIDDGPVKETIMKDDQVDVLSLPSHVIGEKDPGRYIASGLCITKDPDTGIRNMAMHRLQVKEKDKLGIYMVEGKHTWTIYEKYKSMGEAMPIAVVIGHHPMYYFAAAYSGNYILDELEVAGSLLGETVDLVKCETVNLEVPAYGEIVLECEALPDIEEEEGPFAEFTDYYGSRMKRPVLRIKAMTARHDCIYKAVQSSAHSESIFYNSIPMAAAIYRDLQNVGGRADISDVSCSWGSTFNVVVQMKPRFFGEAKQVLLAAVSSVYSHQKVAIAVDEDVDIYDPQDVAWAIATRVNPEVDISVVSGVRGHPLDNSLPEVDDPAVEPWHRVGSRCVIDATKPPTSDLHGRGMFDRVRPPSGEGPVTVTSDSAPQRGV